jgi:hypothetical protein
MKTVKYTAEMKAFLPDYYSAECLKDGTCIEKVHLTAGNGDYCKEQGYPLVGMATVTLEILIDEEDLIASKVDALKTKLQKERADSEVRCNAILEQISKLQALEYTA